MNKGEKVEITWIDANSESGWWNEEDIEDRLKTFVPQKTIGYFVMYYKDWIVLAMTDMCDERYKRWGFWKAVPKKQIKKLKKIKN
jgi:hypothetical protein